MHRVVFQWVYQKIVNYYSCSVIMKNAEYHLRKSALTSAGRNHLHCFWACCKQHAHFYNVLESGGTGDIADPYLPAIKAAFIAGWQIPILRQKHSL